MMNVYSLFEEVLILFGGVVVVFFIFKKFGFGIVFGYFVVGVVIGLVMYFICGVEDIFGVVEFGVVFLFFVIGFELKLLWFW